MTMQAQQTVYILIPTENVHLLEEFNSYKDVLL